MNAISIRPFDVSPCLTIVEYRHPCPDHVERIHGAFPDSVEGCEDAELALASLNENRRIGFGYRIAPIAEAVPLIEGHFSCLVGMIVETEQAATSDGLAAIFRRINESIIALERPELAADQKGGA